MGFPWLCEYVQLIFIIQETDHPPKKKKKKKKTWRTEGKLLHKYTSSNSCKHQKNHDLASKTAKIIVFIKSVKLGFFDFVCTTHIYFLQENDPPQKKKNNNNNIINDRLTLFSVKSVTLDFFDSVCTTHTFCTSKLNIKQMTDEPYLPMGLLCQYNNFIGGGGAIIMFDPFFLSGCHSGT